MGKATASHQVNKQEEIHEERFFLEGRTGNLVKSFRTNKLNIGRTNKHEQLVSKYHKPKTSYIKSKIY